MTRYEAIGCGIYEVDPATKLGDPAGREAVACTEFTASTKVQFALATRVAAALNGSEALLDTLKAIAQFQRDKCENADAEMLFMLLDIKVEMARAAIKAAEGVTG